MDNSSSVPNQEDIYKHYSNTEGNHVTLRPRYNNVSWMIFLVENFMNPCELFLDYFTATFTVAKYFFLLLKQLRLAGCDTDYAFPEGSMEILVEVYALQLFKP